MTEISTRPLKQHGDEFPEPVRSLIQQEPEIIDLERFINDFGTFERIIKLQKEGKNHES